MNTAVPSSSYMNTSGAASVAATSERGQVRMAVSNLTLRRLIHNSILVGGISGCLILCLAPYLRLASIGCLTSYINIKSTPVDWVPKLMSLGIANSMMNDVIYYVKDKDVRKRCTRCWIILPYGN